MELPRDLRYTSTHEWVRQEGNAVVVGISDFAQSQLSDLTYVELPAVDDKVNVQDEVAVVESVKAASDVFSPVAGKIIAVNDKTIENPELINKDPYNSGWLFKLELDDPAELKNLLSADEYEELIPDED